MCYYLLLRSNFNRTAHTIGKLLVVTHFSHSEQNWFYIFLEVKTTLSRYIDILTLKDSS